MKIITTSATIIAVIGAVYIGLFFYQPEPQTLDRAIDTVTTALPELPVVPEPTPLEQARQELQQATDRLNREEARLLGEIDAATTTAAHEIAQLREEIAAIEARRDGEVARLEAGIEEINTTRASF